MPTEISTHAIHVSGLRKQFGAVEALRGLDLTVERGSVFGFLGPNGAGKTTALNILAGLADPTSGSATILGHDVAEDGMAVRERIGFLRQDPRFYKWMTGRETLQFTGRFFAMETAAIDRRAEELLKLVDLANAADRRMGGYSGGMRQRLGIAQALMGNPQVLLLDEPCSSLDPAGRLEVITIMDRLRGATTVFYSTHILQDVERVADEVAIISGGRCVRQGTMAALLAGSGDELVVEIEGDAQEVAGDLRRLPFVQAVATEEAGDGLKRFTLRVDDLELARRAVPAVVIGRGDVVFVSCRPHKLDLESVFLALTGGQSGDSR